MKGEYQKYKDNFLAGNPKGCPAWFEKHGYYTEAAYCRTVSDEIDKAEALFAAAEQYDPRAHWGLVLLQMIRGNINSFPTYFQIRNFLEIDLNILIKYYKSEYIENIIKYADFLAYYNPESYKFIGRVFWANNIMSPAMFFLNRAKDKFYTDPELHYLLAYIYYCENDFANCKKLVNSCLNLLPGYNPAVKLQNKLNG